MLPAIAKSVKKNELKRNFFFNKDKNAKKRIQKKTVAVWSPSAGKTTQLDGIEIVVIFEVS